MKCLPSIVRMLLLAFCLAAGQASANIAYTFAGVTFSDGGTLNGTFTTNDAITSLLDYNITTSPAADIGFNYTTATAGSSSTSLPFILVLSTASLDNILQVTFSGLTAAGGGITLGTFDSFEQTLSARRDIVSGEVIVAAAVPEPETYAMLLAGLGLMGFAARRRKHRGA